MKINILLLTTISLILVGCTLSDAAIQTAISETLNVEEESNIDDTAEFIESKKNTAESNIATKTAAPTLTPSNTLTPEPTNTPLPTDTPKPTNTPLPTATQTATKSLEDEREEFLFATTNAIERNEELGEIERINVVRFGNPGILQIELNTDNYARGNQPDVSYDLIQFLAYFLLNNFNNDELYRIGGNDEFIIHITTYSTDGDYRYQSFTDFKILEQILAKKITYEEWVEAANAGFQ